MEGAKEGRDKKKEKIIKGPDDVHEGGCTYVHQARDQPFSASHECIIMPETRPQPSR